MTAYLTFAEFKVLSVMPDVDLDALEVMAPGYVDGQLAAKSRWIDSRLRKRYAVPFADPSETVLDWLTRLVTVRCFLRRGVDPLDEQFAEIKQDAADAAAEIKEAAEAVDGLFELPLLDAGDDGAVSKGGPFGYSEQSPYVWMDGQSETGRDEDRNGSGTHG